MQADKELRESGLSPGAWKDSLAKIQARLSPGDWDRFSRLHRNFVGYRNEDTLARFYGFAFSRDLQFDINAHRFARLSGILESLAESIEPGQTILDIGAGSGLIAGVVKRCLAPSAYVVQDPCPDIRDSLACQGFSVLPHPAPSLPPDRPFDRILCIDSLGEVNADEDGMLSETAEISAGDYAVMLEERYGIAQKLRPWRPYLAQQGRVLIWEPLKHRRAWEALSTLLLEEGWIPEFHAHRPQTPYLELKLA